MQMSPPPSFPKNPIDQVVRPWTDIPWMPSSFVIAHIFVTRVRAHNDIDADVLKQRPEKCNFCMKFSLLEMLARPARVPTCPAALLPRGSGQSSKSELYYGMASDGSSSLTELRHKESTIS